MPLDRADAVVIGAGVEGLSAALSLALSGKQVVCADKRETVDALGRPDAASMAPAAAHQLGLFRHSLRLSTPHAHLSLTDGRWLALWPDAARTARGLAQPEADAFEETAATIRRLRAQLREPGAAARGMLASLELTPSAEGATGAFLRRSASRFLERSLGNGALSALLLAMAARQAPADPDEVGSAPMLLSLAAFFDVSADGPKPVAGGQRAAIAALAHAFRAAGGDLALGQDVREIQMDREAVTAVALASGRAIKTPLAIAALAPRRLAQGLLSTRRHGTLLSRLRRAPRHAQAMLAVSFRDTPDLPQRSMGLWRGGVSVWLGATMERLRSAVRAMQAQQIAPTPVLEVRFAPGLNAAVVVAPYCPGALAEGPWTEGRRSVLADVLLSTIRAEWPSAHALIDTATLLTPRPPDTLSATGAIFATAERMPDLDVLFGLSGDAPAPLLKGLYLCDPRGFEPAGHAGLSVAAVAGGAAPGRVRA